MMADSRTNKIIRVVSFALFLLYIILLHELTTAITQSWSYEARANISTWVFFGTFALMYVALVLFMKWEGSSDIFDLGMQSDNRTVFHITIGAIAGVAAGSFVYAIALGFGGEVRPLSDITMDLIVSEIIITTPVAVFEELCYRGYLMTRMSELMGKPLAIIGSALWFGLLHFGWWLPLGSVPLHMIVIYVFNMSLGGVLLGVSYYWSGERLWVPIAFHFCWNMLAYILFLIYPTAPVTSPEIFQIEWGITTIPAFILGMLVIWTLLLIWKKR